MYETEFQTFSWQKYMELHKKWPAFLQCIYEFLYSSDQMKHLIDAKLLPYINYQSLSLLLDNY